MHLEVNLAYLSRILYFYCINVRLVCNLLYMKKMNLVLAGCGDTSLKTVESLLIHSLPYSLIITLSFIFLNSSHRNSDVSYAVNSFVMFLNVCNSVTVLKG